MSVFLWLLWFYECTKKIIYLACWGPVLYESYDEEAVMASSAMCPVSKPRVWLQWPVFVKETTFKQHLG